MKISTLVSLLVGAGLCLAAELKPATESFVGGPDKGRKNHLVGVAQDDHVFTPTVVNASIGDTITFRFFPRLHSVVLADYDSPCVPWSVRNLGEDDKWSGLIEEDDYSELNKQWTIKVTTEDPQFFYCSGPTSCNEWGMVFAINPTEEKTWDDFHERAKKRSYQLSPGELAPNESGEPPNNGGGSKKKLSTGAIVGIVIGAVAAIALVGALFYLMGRLKTQKTKESQAESVTLNPDAVNGATSSALPPPPMYEHHAHLPNSTAPEMQQGYYPYDANAKAPVVMPGSPVPTQYDPRMSTYVGSPNLSVQQGGQPHQGHMSWASELGATPAQEIAPVEIYTPGQEVQPKK